MNGNWDEVPFGEVVESSLFGPRFSSDNYADDGSIASLRTTDLSEDGRISYDTMPHAKLDEAKFSKHFLQPGDLVISRSGRVGTTAVFDSYSQPVLPAAFLIRCRLKESASPLFFRYWFNSYVGQQRVQSIARGVAQQNINKTNLLKLDVPLPPQLVQQRIVEILSIYDDLIEVNEERIQRLERAARLLYREWFVRLRFPGHEHASVEDGVPEGWEQFEMDEVCNSIGGGTPKTKVEEYWRDGDIIWFTPSDVTASDSLILLDSDRKINERGLNNSSTKMLPPNTILMTSRASVGFFGLHDGPACTNQGFISVVPHREKMRMYLLHNLMARRREIDILASGSTYKEINKTTFRGMGIVVPPDALLDEFGDFAWNTVKQVRALERQNAKLREARDLLLPRLMNGEIEV